MKLYQTTLVFLALWAFAIGTVLAAESGITLKPTEIRTSPYTDAPTVASLAKGETVELLRRQSGWYHIKSSKAEGWVRMLNIRRGTVRSRKVAPDELVELASGRAGTGKIVSTTGIRGFSEEDLKQANYNRSELKKMEGFTLTAKQAQIFAAQGKLRTQSIKYLPSRD